MAQLVAPKIKLSMISLSLSHRRKSSGVMGTTDKIAKDYVPAAWNKIKIFHEDVGLCGAKFDPEEVKPSSRQMPPLEFASCSFGKYVGLTPRLNRSLKTGIGHRVELDDVVVGDSHAILHRWSLTPKRSIEQAVLGSLHSAFRSVMTIPARQFGELRFSEISL